MSNNLLFIQIDFLLKKIITQLTHFNNMTIGNLVINMKLYFRVGITMK